MGSPFRVTDSSGPLFALYAERSPSVVYAHSLGDANVNKDVFGKSDARSQPHTNRPAAAPGVPGPIAVRVVG